MERTTNYRQFNNAGLIKKEEEREKNTEQWTVVVWVIIAG